MQAALSKTSRSGSSLKFEMTAFVKSVSSELISRVSEISPRCTVCFCSAILS